MPSHRNQVTYSKHPTHAARAAHAKGDREFRTYDTSMIRPKRSKVPGVIAIIVVVVIIAAIIGGILYAASGCARQLLPESEEATITVVQGESAATIGKSLEEAGLVRSAGEFTDRVNSLNAAAELKPGTYLFAGMTPIDDIIAALRAGAPSAMVTIPEGSTLKQAAAAVEEDSGGRITAEAFIAAASKAQTYAADYPFVEAAGTQSLEGFLFPKTYAIEDDSTADSLIRAMLKQYALETESLDYTYATSQGLSAYDVLKLASIIEKEADVNNRATVSSVFYNRLGSGMRLQSDATVAYFVGHDPTPADVATENPYNTYTIDGLPPTPINSPSIEAIQAACAPESTPYLYFYFAEDDSGTMQYYFSETYEDHRSTFE